MSLRKRLFFYVCMIIGQNLYLPINYLNHGGTTVDIWIDKFIPIWPIWTPIYFLWIPAWMLVYLWATFKMEVRLFRALFIASMVTFLTAMLIFVFFPTYIIRPTLVGTDFFTNWLRWIYTNDKAYNAFPSGHIYLTLLVVLFWSRWFPKTKWWLWIVFIFVTLSTLFTKQHVIVDLLGGAFLAIIADRFANWVIFKYGEGCRPRIATTLKTQPMLDENGDSQ